MVVDGEMTYPSQMNEYHFDSLSRLVAVNYSIYRIETNELENEVGVSMYHRQVIKYRYDRDGRRVESDTKNYTYQSDVMKMNCISGYLVSLDENNEKWEMTTTNEDGGIAASEMFCRYEENQISVNVIDSDAQKEEHIVRAFDAKKNLIEIRHMDDKDETFCMMYKYDENDQLVEMDHRGLPDSDEIIKTYFEMDEFDNEGNWLKRTALDENKEILHITRRRIEYRIP